MFPKKLALIVSNRLLLQSYTLKNSSYCNQHFISTTANFYQKKYNSKHQWIDDTDNEVYVGLSKHAVDAMGEIVFIELQKEGTIVKKDDSIAVIESSKSAVEYNSPVSGTIGVVNAHLEDSPDILNKAAESRGWIYKIKLENPSELSDFMSVDEYKEFLRIKSS